MAPFIVRFITSPNINRFSKLFHCQNQETICNKTVITDPTTPLLFSRHRHFTRCCSDTLWVWWNL